ncbi:MAG: ATP-binding protein [Spirochaetia bacterium]|nr:ATP-binding protein [Spirochaetia bacterium]
MFKRKIYDKLLDWKKDSRGKTALLIEGARRVGKSTIVKRFAENEYSSYIMIDFAYASATIQNLYKDLSDLDYFFLQLQLQYGVNLVERKSLIIFDEVQFNPLARQAIKLLVADGRYDYIETGSLISIRKNVKDILIPSEERKIQMYPMDFEEFLWATGDTNTSKLLKKMYDDKISIGDGQNRNMMRKFRLYMLVGGMPQSIKAYTESNNLQIVDQVKRDIINLYEDDFYKIDPKGKISALYDAIPSELNKHSSSYQISSVLPNDRKDSISEEITELKSSKTVVASYNVTDPNIGLSNMYNQDKFKLYLVDTGLLVTLIFKDKDFTDNIIYTKLLNDKLPVNLGIIYENAVAQTFATNGNKLFYHTFYDTKQKRNYEVDFLLAKGDKICPVEVKSSSYKTHKSLDMFSEKYSSRINEKVVIYTKDLNVQGHTIYLPIYLTMFL